MLHIHPNRILVMTFSLMVASWKRERRFLHFSMVIDLEVEQYYFQMQNKWFLVENVQHLWIYISQQSRRVINSFLSFVIFRCIWHWIICLLCYRISVDMPGVIYRRGWQWISICFIVGYQFKKLYVILLVCKQNNAIESLVFLAAKLT